jgi:hypothetical protein
VSSLDAWSNEDRARELVAHHGIIPTTRSVLVGVSGAFGGVMLLSAGVQTTGESGASRYGVTLRLGFVA